MNRRRGWPINRRRTGMLSHPSRSPPDAKPRGSTAGRAGRRCRGQARPDLGVSGRLSAMRTVVVTGDGLTVDDVVDVAAGRARAVLGPDVPARMEASREIVTAALRSD